MRNVVSLSLFNIEVSSQISHKTIVLKEGECLSVNIQTVNV